MLSATLACQGAAADRKAPAKPASSTLQLKDGRLDCYVGGKPQPLVAKSPVPYRIVFSAKAYSLVTTCGAELSPVTYSTDGVNIRAFKDMLPLLVQGPVCALQGLSDSEVGGATGVVLLGARGEEVWRDPQADLLWPVTGEARDDAFCISEGSDTNPLGVYGLQPALVRVAATAGAEIWRKPVASAQYVEDATVYGVGSKYGVLCLQYGVDSYEFFSFDIATGSTKSLKALDGVPAFTSFYPGPIPEPAGVELKGDELSVQVQHLDGSWYRLVFDLAAGTMKQLPGKVQSGLSERNPHPGGGGGAPKPPLFPQGILPTQSGSSWTIPALVNAQVQVFVVTPSGASWVTP